MGLQFVHFCVHVVNKLRFFAERENAEQHFAARSHGFEKVCRALFCRTAVSGGGLRLGSGRCGRKIACVALFEVVFDVLERVELFVEFVKREVTRIGHNRRSLNMFAPTVDLHGEHARRLDLTPEVRSFANNVRRERDEYFPDAHYRNAHRRCQGRDSALLLLHGRHACSAFACVIHARRYGEGCLAFTNPARRTRAGRLTNHAGKPILCRGVRGFL